METIFYFNIPFMNNFYLVIGVAFCIVLGENGSTSNSIYIVCNFMIEITLLRCFYRPAKNHNNKYRYDVINSWPYTLFLIKRLQKGTFSVSSVSFPLRRVLRLNVYYDIRGNIHRILKINLSIKSDKNVFFDNSPQVAAIFKPKIDIIDTTTNKVQG